MSTTSKHREAEVVIVGGGLNGPLLALALAQGGISSTVIDAGERSRAADPSFDGRAYALSTGTLRMLGALGLWAGLKDRSQPIWEMKISDGRPGEGVGPAWLHFDAAELEDGPLGHMLEDRHLRGALIEAVEASPRIRMRWNETVVSQSRRADGAEVRLAGGSRVDARLLVGCDGRRSGTARRAGIGRDTYDYGQMALVLAVAHARPHGGVAHQFFMPGGLLAILPIAGDRSSLVWVEPTSRAEALVGLDEEQLIAMLRPRFGDFLGEIRLIGERHSFPLSLSLAERLVAERVVLVGDAAHGVHPLAGQGLNLGFRDVATLAEVLVDARRSGSDLAAPDVLDRYACWRGSDAAALAITTDGISRLFSSDNPALRLGRALGIGLLGQAPFLRRGMARAAMGVAGELPRLQRGIAL